MWPSRSAYAVLNSGSCCIRIASFHSARLRARPMRQNCSNSRGRSIAATRIAIVAPLRSATTGP